MKNSILSIAAMALLSGNAIAQQKPNIILFLVDDMGWQDTSLPFWNDTTELNHIYETPNMERLAKKGVRFTHAYACPISSPSRVSLFTGANAARHKVTNWTLKKDTPTDRKNEMLDFEAWNYNGLCPEPGLEHSFYAKCLPQLLRENGYTTMMVGKAHFGSIDTPAANPLAIGFDYNIAGHAAGAMGSYLGEEGYGASGKPEWAAIWAVPDLEKYHGTDTFLTEALTLEAKGLMDKALDQSKPFFLYMAHHAVHTPLKAPQTLIDKYQKKTKGKYQTNAIYAAMVENLDWNVGRLCHAIDSLGLSENTLIVFYSDNGGAAAATNNFRLRGAKGMPYEGGIRVPLIMKYPRKIKAGTVVSEPVTGVDFYPTLVALTGGIPDNGLDGENIFDRMKKGTSKVQRALFWHFPAYLEGYQGLGRDFRATPYSIIRSGDWKLIYYYEDKSMELFNLKNDRMERNNLVNLQPTLAKELYTRLMKWLIDTRADIPTELNPAYIKAKKQ